MTITLVPRRTTAAAAAADATEAGRLATTLLSVAVAGMAEPNRFRKGRAYVAERAVTRIDVDPGRLTGTVVGTRVDPYRVIVDVVSTTRAAGAVGAPDRPEVMRLTPEPDDIVVACTCPDDADPCKHAVAVLLAFANELGPRPELLAEWRCGTVGEAPRAVVGGRARSERHLRLAPPPAPESPFVSDEWRRFEGDGLPPVPALDALVPTFVPLDPPPTPVGSIDLGQVMASALAVLRSLQP
jgi:hypothetical protein